MIELPERKEVRALLRFVCGLSAFHTFIFASKEKQRLRRPSFSLHKYTRSRSLSFSRPSTAPCPAPRPRPSCSCRSSPFPLPVRLPGWVSWQAGKLGCLRQVNIPTTIDDDDEKTETERGRGESEETGESVERASERESRERRQTGTARTGSCRRHRRAPCRRISSCPAQQ